MKKTEDKLNKIKRTFFRTLSLSLLIAFTAVVAAGCVTQAEIEAARVANNAQSTPVPQTEEMEQLEPMGEDADGGTIGESNTGPDEEEGDQGLISQLVGLLGSRSQALQIIALLTILSLAPSILIMLTSFVRIVMILSFTRNAMGLQQMPPNQVIVALALFLTMFVMWPVLDEIKTEAFIPYAAEVIELDEAVERGVQPLREFMITRTRTSDLGMFYSYTTEPLPQTDDELLHAPMRIIIPSYLTSELRRAFEIGFFIYIPFLVIDMIVASTLMSMGMMMLPPISISLPFKVLMFVLVDGWALTFETILRSFG